MKEHARAKIGMAVLLTLFILFLAFAALSIAAGDKAGLLIAAPAIVWGIARSVPEQYKGWLERRLLLQKLRVPLIAAAAVLFALYILLSRTDVNVWAATCFVLFNFSFFLFCLQEDMRARGKKS